MIGKPNNKPNEQHGQSNFETTLIIKNMKLLYIICCLSILIAIYIRDINLILASLSVGFVAGIVNTFNEHKLH